MNRLLSVIVLLIFASCAGRVTVDYGKKFEEVRAESQNAYSASGVTFTAASGSSDSSSKTSETIKVKTAEKRKGIPLNIESDTMTFNRENQLAVFKGNVVVSSKGIKVVSDTLKSVDYRQSAEAEGNVKAEYSGNKTVLTCKKIRYTDKMRFVKAIGSVKAKNVLADGNTMTVYCDEVDFDTQENIIKARKVLYRIRVEFGDITAFCDYMDYDGKSGELTLTGSPFFRKKRSMFLSDTVKLDVNRKVITLEGKIFGKLTYSEYAAGKKEFKNTAR